VGNGKGLEAEVEAVAAMETASEKGAARSCAQLPRVWGILEETGGGGGLGRFHFAATGAVLWFFLLKTILLF
jgi:hypothetical protein